MADLLKITKIERTCFACPAQWDAWTDDGTYIYIRYRGGRFRVDKGGDPSNFEAGQTIFELRYGDSFDGYLSFNEMAKLTKDVLDFGSLSLKECASADNEDGSSMIAVPKTRGERMVLAPFGTNSAVLLLADREEDVGTFISFRDDSTRRYPVVAFYKPPEFCGIDEPDDDIAYEVLQSELRTELLDSIQSTCAEFKIDTLYCAGVDEPAANEYADELRRRGLELADIKTAEIADMILIVV